MGIYDDTRLFFKQINAGLNLEFSFSRLVTVPWLEMPLGYYCLLA